MIQLYTGVPGSGKTYKMVADLDSFIQGNPDVTVVSNIDGLKLPHEDFKTFVEAALPDERVQKFTFAQRLSMFFTMDKQDELTEKYGPLFYVLDECQAYFPKTAKMPKAEDYFQRHRHKGHNLFLAAQSAKLIAPGLLHLVELEINAVRRSISFFGEIHYRIKSPLTTQIIRSESVFPKKRIFELYQSFESEEMKKPKKALWRRFVIPLIIFPFACYFFYGRILNKGKTDRAPSAPNSANVTQVPNSNQEVERLRKQLLDMKNQMNLNPTITKERVFLPVVRLSYAGGPSYTVDPDTQEVVELRKIKRRVVCINGGLVCYFDRNSDDKVNIVNINYPYQGGSTQGLRSLSAPPLPPSVSGGAGSASFVDSEMVSIFRGSGQ
jgi:hypothetical protein